MPTSVVTGGAGFLGSHLCDYLLGQGHRVVCVDNLETGSLENIAHLRDDSFTFLYHDVIEPIHIDEPIDLIFHLAALASPVDYMRAPLASLKVGSYGTHNALGLAKWKRARFLISSTSEVYGDPQVHPQPETYWGNVNPIGPRGVYDEAKRYAEAMTMTYHTQQGVDTCIARIFNSYGPRMRKNDGRTMTRVDSHVCWFPKSNSITKRRSSKVARMAIFIRACESISIVPARCMTSASSPWCRRGMIIFITSW